MSESTSAMTAEARRDAIRTRDRVSSRCPGCKSRLFKQAGITNIGKLICYNCGGRYKRKKA